jgi:hypothetical protein
MKDLVCGNIFGLFVKRIASGHDVIRALLYLTSVTASSAFSNNRL